MIKITLPDGPVKEYEKGTTPYQIALSISEGLARNVLAAKVNDKVVALNYEINDDASVTLLTWNDPEGKAVYWHSSAHLMAAAISVWVFCTCSSASLSCALKPSSTFSSLGASSVSMVWPQTGQVSP